MSEANTEQLSKTKKELFELGFELSWLNKVREDRANRVLGEMKRRQREKEAEAARILEG